MKYGNNFYILILIIVIQFLGMSCTVRQDISGEISSIRDFTSQDSLGTDSSDLDSSDFDSSGSEPSYINDESSLYPTIAVPTQNNSDQSSDPVLSKTPSPEPTSDSIPDFLPGKQVFLPEEIFTPLRNPDMGWAAYSFEPFTNFLPVYSWGISGYSTMVYSNYFSWRDLEPKEGVYDFSPIQNFVDQWAGHGMKIGIGIHMADATSLPGQIHVPQYIYEQVGGVWIESLYGGAFALPYRTWEPYYWEELLLDSWGNFLTAFADEFASNPSWQNSLTQIDVSSFGQWGEWHTELFNNNLIRTDPNNKKRSSMTTDSQCRTVQIQTMERMSQQYTDLFMNRNDGITYPRLAFNVVYATMTQEEYIYSPQGTLAPGIKHVIEQASTGEVDMFRRFIGGEFYLYGPDRSAIMNNWQKLRFHGEWGSATGSITDGSFGNNTTGNPTTTQEAVQMALDYHASTLGWYVGTVLQSKKLDLVQVPKGNLHDGMEFIAYPGMTLEEYFQANCGYRLVLNKIEFESAIEPGELISLKHNWSQKGAATIYNPYKFKAWLKSSDGKIYSLGSDDSFDPRGWIKKDNKNYPEYNVVTMHRVPSNIPSGYYELHIAVVDPKSEEPAINLAITGKNSNGNNYGTYTMGIMRVGLTSDKVPTVLYSDYTLPDKVQNKRPVLQNAYQQFTRGVKDIEFDGYAGFEFRVSKTLNIYDFSSVITEKKFGYPILFQLIDADNKKVLAKQTFRFIGTGYLEFGQMVKPVRLIPGRKYALLAYYEPENKNLYGEKVEIKSLFRKSTITGLNNNILDINSVTSQDGLNITADEDGINKINGIIGFRFAELP